MLQFQKKKKQKENANKNTAADIPWRPYFENRPRGT